MKQRIASYSDSLPHSSCFQNAANASRIFSREITPAVSKNTTNSLQKRLHQNQNRICPRNNPKPKINRHKHTLRTRPTGSNTSLFIPAHPVLINTIDFRLIPPHGAPIGFRRFRNRKNIIQNRHVNYILD